MEHRKEPPPSAEDLANEARLRAQVASLEDDLARQLATRERVRPEAGTAKARLRVVLLADEVPIRENEDPEVWAQVMVAVLANERRS